MFWLILTLMMAVFIMGIVFDEMNNGMETLNGCSIFLVMALIIFLPPILINSTPEETITIYKVTSASLSNGVLTKANIKISYKDETSALNFIKTNADTIDFVASDKEPIYEIKTTQSKNKWFDNPLNGRIIETFYAPQEYIDNLLKTMP